MISSDLLQRNFKTLLQSSCLVYPEDTDWLREETLEEIHSLCAQSGDIVGIWKGLSLHSRFNPKREAHRTVKESLSQDSDEIVVFGFGLGYHVEAILSIFLGARVWVVEPDQTFFKAALGLRDFSALLNNPRLRILFGTEGKNLDYLLQTLSEVNFSLYRYRPSLEFNAPYYKKLEQALTRIKSRRQVNLNTLSRFGKLWVRNLARNSPLLFKHGGIEVLKGKFSTLPALLIAAGPSLDAILPHLPELASRFLLIAMDTSYNVCCNTGVEPDFVVVMDPQYWNTRHLDRATQQTCRIVSEPSTHPTIFRRLPKKIFLASSLFPLGKFIEGQSGKRGTIGAGGSVATSAWDLARLLGCSPIVCAGLDLSFPNKRTHCRGSFFEERVFSICTRYKPDESYFFGYLQDGLPFWMPSNTDSPVLTDQRMLVYKDWFELQTKIHPETLTYTLSLYGLKIEGIQPIDIEKILGFPPCRSTLDAALNQIDTTAIPIPDHQNIVAAKEHLNCGLHELAEIASEGISTVEILKKQLEAGRELDLHLLNCIDEKILSHKLHDIAGFLLADNLIELNTASNGISIAKVLENSHKIYSKLLASILYHREVLKDFLQ